MITTSRLTGIYDKGSGAVIAAESRSVDATSGELAVHDVIVPVRQGRRWIRRRARAGVGAPRPSRTGARPRLRAQTRPDQALLYRLVGDRNPLHSDPGFAAAAGFGKPILHGLCTYGFAGRLLLHGLCGSDPARFISMDGRFSRPVLPGDALGRQGVAPRRR